MQINYRKIRFISFFLINLFTHVAFALQIEKSPNDPREFAYTKLSNGLQVMVVSDEKSQHSACSLEIRAGSFDEPSNIPGLAHFVEHALFLGTKSHPKPDEFKQIIDRNGGNYNATTGDNTTRFYFTIQPDALDNTLSLFSSFFIEPLFSKEYLEREKNAVHAEYQMNLESDSMRALDVNKVLSNEAHPYHRFNVGNLHTLSSQKFDLQKEAILFFENHYAPSEMTLSLVGPQSTATLIKIAEKYFSKIPVRSFKAKTHPAAFLEKDKQIDISIKSQAPYNELTLTFLLSKFEKYHKEKPLNFVMHILASKTKGSLYHYLKDKNWINDLMVDDATFLQQEDLLNVSFTLTPEGMAHQDDITQAFFAYIDFIKQAKYPRQYYNDLKAIDALEWKYYEPEEPLELASLLTANLQKYPADKVLTYNFSFNAPEYDANLPLIEKVLNEISLKNMRRVFLNKDIKGEKETIWYRANYKVQKLTKLNPMLKEPIPFALPEKNAYIPENFDILTSKKAEIKAPTKIKVSKTDSIWFAHDANFKAPLASVYINLTTDLTALTPKHVVLTDIFSHLVTDTMQQEFYPAGFAGASLSFYSHARGLGIQFYGYNDKQAQLVKSIFAKLREYQVDPLKFALAKDEISRSYQSVYQNALHEQANMCLLSLINKQSYHVDELISVIEDVKIEELVQFIQALRNDYSPEMLVNGNHSEEEAKEMMRFVQIENVNKKKVLPLYTLKLTPGKTYFKEIKANRDNHVLTWYLQNKESSDAMVAKTAILERLISNAFYANLRTEQQLGYAVYTQTHVNHKVSGFIFCIESPQEPKVLMKRIEDFLQNHQKEIKKLSKEDLEQVKAALINNISQPPTSLSEQSGDFFWPIQSGELDFSYKEKTIKAIKKVTVKDITKLYDSLLAKKMAQVIIATKDPLEKENTIVLNNWQELKQHA